jgi:UDP-sulfoquinovose synthase
MRILILGIDGYLGWSLANFLSGKKYSIYGVDNFYRRKWVKEMHSLSAIPIASMSERVKAYKKEYKKNIEFYKGDITNYKFLSGIIKKVQPDVIVHFGQCPSAPYSMMNQEKCVWVQKNNLVGTLNLVYGVKEFAPNTHIVKLGTMGEYGTPNIDIPEGFFEIEYRGRKDRLPFPRQANSWYHLSKVHDSNNLQFACKNYGIRCTDIMQGIVFGFHPQANASIHELNTRLDFDEAFGTIMNRYCCQAVIGYPLTSYGKGTQKRSFLPLSDSMKCIQLVIQNPPGAGEYRVINKYANVYSINDLATKVADVCKELGIHIKVSPIKNPRKEKEKHYYNPHNENLQKLGYHPSSDFDEATRKMILRLLPYHKRIMKYRSILNPVIQW